MSHVSRPVIKFQTLAALRKLGVENGLWQVIKEATNFVYMKLVSIVDTTEHKVTFMVNFTNGR